jgi:hypothetical protein
MLLLTFTLQILALAYAFVLPGVSLSQAAGRDWSLPMRLGAGFCLGILVVPLLSFCGAWVLGTNVQPWLVLASASVVNLSWPAAWAWRRRSGPVPTRVS